MRNILYLLAALTITVALRPLNAQFAGTGTTTVSVTVQPESGIRIDTAVTSLTSVGTTFANYTGSTSFTYKVRTAGSTGAGTIQIQITSDFSPANGPSVASPPTAGDQLAYTCSVTSPATACSGSQVASTTAQTPVATFGAGASSAAAGNTGTLNWTLTNDPAYRTGSYTATATFTISAT